jgi:NADPH:quinone reductase
MTHVPGSAVERASSADRAFLAMETETRRCSSACFCCSEEHAETIRVRFIDYVAGDVVAAARELVPDGFDGIVDLVGGTSLRTVAPLPGSPAPSSRG